jgi:predicted Zn-ribbon and HTH transcriptional regulator
MLELSLGTQNVDRRDTRFERQDWPLGVCSHIRHALEAHRHAADDLLIQPQQPHCKGCGPEIFEAPMGCEDGGGARRVIGRLRSGSI